MTIGELTILWKLRCRSCINLLWLLIVVLLASILISVILPQASTATPTVVLTAVISGHTCLIRVFVNYIGIGIFGMPEVARLEARVVVESNLGGRK